MYVNLSYRDLADICFSLELLIGYRKSRGISYDYLISLKRFLYDFLYESISIDSMFYYH